MAEDALARITGVITHFEPSRSPFEGRATVACGGFWGTISAAGFFFDPLPGMEVAMSVNARRSGRRQPTFSVRSAQSIGFRAISCRTVQSLEELGHVTAIDADVAAEALRAGEAWATALFAPAFNALSGARDLDGLLRTFPFDEPPTAEMVRVLHKRNVRPEQYATALRDNPYLLLLLREYRSRFEWIDRIAASLGIDPGSSDRLIGALRSELVRAEFQGSNCVDYSQLVDSAAKTISRSAAYHASVPNSGDFAAAASSAIAVRDLLPIQSKAGYALAFPEHVGVAQSIRARLLDRMNAGVCVARRHGLDRARVASELATFPWNAEQQTAIETMISEPVSLMQGPPGTGKTQVIGGVTRLVRGCGGIVKIVSTAGLAARRVGHGATTAARLLGYNGFEYTAPRIEADLLIIDEASQLEDQTLLALLDRYDGPILLAGDPDQLPPIGIGNPFGDLLDSRAFPVSQLTKILRQIGPARQHINDAARAALTGDYLRMEAILQNPDAKPYVRIVEPGTYDDSDADVQAAVLRALGDVPLADLDQIQVLSRIAKVGPTISAQHLHEAIRNKYNPRREGIAPFIVQRDDHYAFEIRPGDRVMQSTRNINESHLRLANGDLLHVEAVDDKAITARVVDTGEVFRMSRNDCRWLVGGFASSIHKTQGSQYKHVVIALSYDQRSLPGQRMLYTAITRGIERVTFCGARDSLRQAVWFEDVPKRATILSNLLASDPAIERYDDNVVAYT